MVRAFHHLTRELFNGEILFEGETEVAEKRCLLAGCYCSESFPFDGRQLICDLIRWFEKRVGVWTIIELYRVFTSCTLGISVISLNYCPILFPLIVFITLRYLYLVYV